MGESVLLAPGLLFACAGLVLGAMLAGIWLRQRYRDRIVELQTLLEHEQSQTSEKISLLTQARDDMRAQFRLLASDVLDEKSRRFTESSRQGLGDILAPLQEKIARFEKKVDETYSREARERFSLEKEIRNLQLLNARISEDALNLTRALKGESKTQGAWGEFILSSILDASGLVEGREYETQRSLDVDAADQPLQKLSRRSQPDVLIYLPDNRQVIVDAKVSLTAYERFCSAEDKAEQTEHLRQHVLSLKNHIRQLSDKQYQNLPQINSLDFVLLFVPVEPAFSQALQHEPDLFNQAFERNIVLVGPSTLLATLRTIHNIWRYEQQSKNAQDIARRAGAMYDKFVGFVADMDDLGRKLDAGRRSYDAAMNKLQTGKGNLVSRAEQLKTLGARASKQHDAERLERALDNDDGDGSDERAQ